MAISPAALKEKKSQLLTSEWGQIEVWADRPIGMGGLLLELKGKVPTEQLEAVERELLDTFWPGPLFLRSRFAQPNGLDYLCCPHEPKLRQSIVNYSGNLFATVVSSQFARFVPTLVTRRDGWWSVEQSGFVSVEELRSLLDDPVVLSGGIDQAAWSIPMRCYWLVGAVESLAHRMRKNLDQSGMQDTWMIVSDECSQLFLNDLSDRETLVPGLHAIGPTQEYSEHLERKLSALLAEARKSGIRHFFVQAPSNYPSLDPSFETVRVGAPENSV